MTVLEKTDSAAFHLIETEGRKIVYSKVMPCELFSFEAHVQFCHSMTKHLMETGAAHWLSDVSDMGIVTEAGQAYNSEEWLPKLLQTAALRFNALIMPKNAFGAYTVDELKERLEEANIIGGIVTVKSFLNYEEALQWLTAQG